MFNQDDLFIDLARLRFGMYVNHDIVAGKLWVDYKPFCGHPFPPTVRIAEIPNPDAFMTKPRISTQKGTFQNYFILLEDETGHSPFLNGDLGSRVPELLKTLNKMKVRHELQAATTESVRATLQSGREKVLSEVAQEQKTLQPNQQLGHQRYPALTRGRPDEEEF